MRFMKKRVITGWFMLIALFIGSGTVLANDHAVCIDPGHQGSGIDMSAPEPMAPGSEETKPKCTTGTQGVATGVPEYQLALDISLALEKELTARGYRVEMTRRDNDTAISNSERALYASDHDCDIMVRIHANGSDDQQVSGALAMVMSQTNPYVGNLFEDSYRLALSILNSYCQETGFRNMGIQAHDDMTGINWSKVPVMLLEMGYMSNPDEDKKMQDPKMQELMVRGIADGIDGYFQVGEEGETQAQSETDKEETKPQTEAGKEEIQAQPEAGEKETQTQPEKDKEEAEMHAEPAPAGVPLQGISSLIKQNEDSTEEEIPAEEEDGDTAYDYLSDPLMSQLYGQFIFPKEKQGQKWAISIELLSEQENKEGQENKDDQKASEGETKKEEETKNNAEEKKTYKKTLYEYNGDVVMQSASVIKVFIMGTIFDRVLYPKDDEHKVPDTSNGELNSLLDAMITVSDNNAANRLIEIAGGGDFNKGAETVREFCMENGYVATSIGRRFMEEKPTGDNYTSAADCRKFLSDVYYGRCVGKEASDQMLSILKRQALRNKIPAGLPSGFTCANKTGEMPEGYGLGCIENDIAIVFGPEQSYVLCVLSNDLGGDNTGAQQNIVQISSYLANEFK